ncbi:MAG: amidohydrolase family protein [Dongiaceae bacterium]
MTRTLFTNVTVLDGSGGEPFAGEVLVEGNRIKQVAKAKPGGKGGLPRQGAELVDGGGATLMPGLVESHSHMTFTDPSTLEALGFLPPEEHLLQSVRNAKTLLDQGFTSANSAAAARARFDVVLRNAIDAGHFPGPRSLAASPELTVTGGLGDVRLYHMERTSFALVCDGADEFRRTAREMCREGVDTLKINPSGDELVPFAKADQTVMTEAEVQAVCEVGLQRGKRIATHARNAESVKMSLRHGCQIIYHATLIDEEAMDMLEERKDQIFVSPTLGITYTTSYEASDWGITTDMAAGFGLVRELEIGCENMRKLKKRGVRILPGGDYGFAWNPIGRNARDLEHFVKLLGFTPMEAIVAATRLGGEIMMKGNELGQIKAGYLADILLVDGNPLSDVRILQDRDRLLAIMKDGSFHKKPAAERRAARVAAE